MQDTHDDPPVARPVSRALDQVGQGAEGSGLGPPSGPGFDAPPLPYARRMPVVDEVAFPLVAMPRSRAALDIVAMVAFSVFVMVVIAFSGVGWLLMKWWPRFGLFSTNILIGASTLGAIWLLLKLRGQSVAAIGLNRTNWGRVAIAVLIAVPGCLAAGALSNLFYIMASGFDVSGFVEERTEFFAQIPHISLLWALPFALFVGIHEEVFFRGFLLSRLRTVCGSNVAAIILTSVVFGSLHFYQGLAGIFQTAAVGLVLAIVTTYARTLWPAIIAHALFDTIGLTLAGPLSDMLEDLDVAAAWAPA